MMLALGMFVFMRQTLPHQTMQRDAEYLWPSNSRVGKRDSFQYLGPGKKELPWPVCYTRSSPVES